MMHGRRPHALLSGALAAAPKMAVKIVADTTTSCWNGARSRSSTTSTIAPETIPVS